MKVTKRPAMLAFLLATAWMGSRVWGVVPGGGPVDAARDVFERESRELDKEYEKGVAAAREGYLKDLERIVEYMRRSGDEYGVRPAQAEQDRFKREQTVPAETAPGTPDLIGKARDRYRAALVPAAAARERALQALIAKYVEHLDRLKRRSEGEGNTARAAAATAEIARVSALEHGDGGAGGGGPLKLPRTLARGLALAYVAGHGNGRLVEDLSGHGLQGRLVGVADSDNAADGWAFSESQSVLELDPVRLGGYWSVSVTAHFPLEHVGKRRVLMSSGFRQDHVVVDQAGNLGVESGAFVGCAYNVNALKGWHTLDAVARWNKTVFFIDGKPVGEAAAICRENLTAIGNTTASGFPWQGAIRGILLWTRALTDGEIAALPR